jgi:hypothetical protein
MVLVAVLVIVKENREQYSCVTVMSFFNKCWEYCWFPSEIQKGIMEHLVY